MDALLVLLSVLLGIVMIVAWDDIFLKAGYSRWLCFLMAVPVVNLVVFFVFAFGKWPIRNRSANNTQL